MAGLEVVLWVLKVKAEAQLCRKIVCMGGKTLCWFRSKHSSNIHPYFRESLDLPAEGTL